MAYEYEKNVVAEIKELGARYKAPSFYAMADEVEEVYAKAKILNKIIDIVKTGRSLEDVEDVEVTLLAIEHELNYMLEEKSND
ncbi:hypothetical protein P3U41_06105 [Mammaliicoccus sciuri]|uniref:hypothetical protein n=1 Tax=Mammaliicoccus sciuri TaxID=1296 RepID=UPI002B256B40|nr:hypothetical protein [Mammaliicoccus sciuri]WQL34344.1 hypothetical protein P3U41_06105 [Mammaliicoccus sciuri]WQL61283.1 hypothetical protein P3T96_06105 [Mammaliicoccus sciuri]